ncbi:MAG: hypothetical protein IT355_01330 [Gemmatimonadaceae bacterium]|nr:hypothetical protein [Gemmatimonadaceae bacterium]
MPAAVSRQVAATLARRVGRDACAADIADVVVALWREIETLLAPLVGRKGVAALHFRSLFLVAPAHPQLARPASDVLDSIDFDWLHRSTAATPAADALAGAGAQFTAFDALLSSMIGPALSARLLHSVWEHPSSGDAAQDKTT